MSWIESIQRGYTITTGDGVKYTVNWLNAKRAVEYNIAQFNFKGVSGTLIERSLPMGRTYDIEIYFQGADNLTKASDFMDSSEDSGYWTIAHPMYGTLQVQPDGLELDDTDYNVTKITCKVMETIGVNAIATNISPIDVIQAQKLQTDITFATAFTTNIPIPDADTIQALQNNITLAEILENTFATINSDAQATRNAYNTANAAISKAVSDVNTAISTVQYLLNLPAIFENTVFNRINYFANTINNLYSSITNLTLPNLKRIYENNVAALLGSMCVSSVNNITSSDYPNRASALQVIYIITSSYNTYLTNLDALQTANGGNTDSYIPDADSYIAMQTLIRYTVSNLFSIAANTRQQRITTLANDSNLILIAYKIYGLLPDDSTITQIINDNNIGLNELLILKKGRQIIYYV